MNENHIENISFYKDELLNYKQLFSSEINSYSFIEVEDILLKNTRIEEIISDDAGVLIEVYNLISDFFYQTENEECLLLRNDKNMKIFFDYCYYKYFWQKDDKLLELEKELPSFNYSEFVKIYKKLIGVFVNSINIVDI